MVWPKHRLFGIQLICMSKIFIERDNGTQESHEEAVIREMLDRGEISHKTPAWRKGMKEWGTVMEALNTVPKSSEPITLLPLGMVLLRAAGGRGRSDDGATIQFVWKWANVILAWSVIVCGLAAFTRQFVIAIKNISGDASLDMLLGFGFLIAALVLHWSVITLGDSARKSLTQYRPVLHDRGILDGLCWIFLGVALFSLMNAGFWGIRSENWGVFRFFAWVAVYAGAVFYALANPQYWARVDTETPIKPGENTLVLSSVLLRMVAAALWLAGALFGPFYALAMWYLAFEVRALEIRMNEYDFWIALAAVYAWAIIPIVGYGFILAFLTILEWLSALFRIERQLTDSHQSESKTN